MVLRVPYSQQFSPEQTPLKKLLPILRQNAAEAGKLKKAIAAAFFKSTKTPARLAGNTMISLKTYGILDGDGSLTAFGKEIVAAQGDADAALRLIAKRLLVDMDGVSVVETIREMNAAGLKIELKSLPDELRQRGIEASDNSSDLSAVLGWLRAAKVMENKYDVNEQVYTEITGTPAGTIQVLKNLTREQIAFLRAMVALNVTDWIPYNKICQQSEALYSGEISYNWKDIVAGVLKPLQDTGLIEIRKKAKQDQNTPEGRGGKPADVKPTGKFEKEVAEPILASLYKAAGYADIRTIRSMALPAIVEEIEKGIDQNKRGKALEYLAIRLCQLLDLDFMGWRETDEVVAAGGEVDALFHAARLTYSRWQIQCKAGPVTTEAVAKEVGMKDVTLANVILVVGTKKATEGAQTFRRKIVSSSNLNIIIIDGPLLQTIIKDQTQLVEILRKQAENAMRLKPRLDRLRAKPPSTGGEGSSGTGEGEGSSPDALPPAVSKRFNRAYSTDLGHAYQGDSLAVLPYLIDKGVRVKLIVTSPPFALVRKKDYGNEDAESYLRWFEQFTPLFKQILSPDGSIVIDIGGAWVKGLPVKSTYHFKLLLQICESGFYLAQDFYHYNPARLPTPAEWVTVRRLRVKDAINNVWFTLDPFVKSDNRRVLRPYSESMLGLLKNGYKAQLRPSGHDISTKFRKDNSGSIPPNLLELSNTESNSYYLRRCKETCIKPHPARYPQALPEFFIRFLTEPDDLVLDPFAGSNVTGAAAQALGRQWISIELDPSYVEASKFRFEQSPSLTLDVSGANNGTKVAAPVPLPASQQELLDLR
jgi:site-specific DNA-methyltransferase (cytosine-N4-specific)